MVGDWRAFKGPLTVVPDFGVLAQIFVAAEAARRQRKSQVHGGTKPRYDGRKAKARRRMAAQSRKRNRAA